jgi:hypothetical protein
MPTTTTLALAPDRWGVAAQIGTEGKCPPHSLGLDWVGDSAGKREHDRASWRRHRQCYRPGRTERLRPPNQQDYDHGARLAAQMANATGGPPRAGGRRSATGTGRPVMTVDESPLSAPRPSPLRLSPLRPARQFVAALRRCHPAGEQIVTRAHASNGQPGLAAAQSGNRGAPLNTTQPSAI